MSERLKSLKNILKPSVLDIVFVTILVFILFIDCGGHILKDADTGFHIMTGNFILNNLEFPSKDIFSYTCAGQKWVAFSWGTDVLFAIANKLAGLNGVVILCTLVILATIFIIYKFLLYYKVNFYVLVTSMVLFTCLMTVHCLARPHLFTIFFTVLSFFLLELAKKNKIIYYSIPFIMLIWANIHPGFISGFFILGAYFAGNLLESLFQQDIEKQLCLKNAKYLFIVIIVSLLFSLINPYGLELIAYIHNTLTSYWIVNATNEYKSPNFHGEFSVMVYIIILLTFLIIGLSKDKRVLDFPKILILLLWLHLSLFSIRNIAVFGVIAIPCLALILDESIKKLDFKRLKESSEAFLAIEINCKYHFWPLLVIILSIFLALNNGYFFDKKVLNCSFSPEYIPVRAMKYYEEHPIKGNMLNNDNWGGYIIYAYPKTKVFMDGRLDMYQQVFLDQYQTIVSGGPGWDKLMAKYDVQWILFDNKTLLYNLLENTPEWKKVYQDELSSIFIRTKPYNQTKLR